MRPLLISLLLCSPVLACDLSCPQRVAEKAVSGHFGELKWWQAVGYKKLLNSEPEEMLAWVTCYSHLDPGCNRTTASGMPVSGRVAAMLDQPWGTFVLIHLPKGFELRQVYDTGSRRNRWRARRKGAEVWVDRYLPYQSQRSWVRKVYVF